MLLRVNLYKFVLPTPKEYLIFAIDTSSIVPQFLAIDNYASQLCDDIIHSI